MADPEYFTLDEFRALPDMSDAEDPTDARIEAAAAYFTAIVEREIGGPFTPRTNTVTVDGNDDVALWLPLTNIRSVESVAVEGSEVSPALLGYSSGTLRYLDGLTTWTAGISNVVVTYTTGDYEEVPADIKDAVMWATRDRLLQQSDQAGVDIRRTSVTTDFGTTSYVLPGEKRPTGYPDLDAVILSYQRGRPFYGSLTIA